MTRTNAEQWQTWRDRFEQRHRGVLRLFYDRGIWRSIQAMLDQNPAVPRGGLGEQWLASCYATSQLIGMRRETDDDKGTTGMLRALRNLEGRPRMVTRAWYEQQIRTDFPGRETWEYDEMNALFNQFADRGKAYIDIGRVTADIARLTGVIDRVKTYTNKVIAHREAKITVGATTALPIIWDELDDALNNIGAIHAKYYSLSRPGQTHPILTPYIPPMWMHMFGTAWMSPGFTPPDYLDNNPPGLLT